LSIDTVEPASDLYNTDVYDAITQAIEALSPQSNDYRNAIRLALEFGSLASMFPELGHPDDGYIARTIRSTEKFFNEAADSLALRHRLASPVRRAVRLNDGSVLVTRQVDSASFKAGQLGLDPDYVLVAANRYDGPVIQWYSDPRYPIEMGATKFASLGTLLTEGGLVLGEPQAADYDIRLYSLPSN
jgi:hypothetical protein